MWIDLILPRKCYNHVLLFTLRCMYETLLKVKLRQLRHLQTKLPQTNYTGHRKEGCLKVMMWVKMEGENGCISSTDTSRNIIPLPFAIRLASSFPY